jgi:hypothetical protein
MSARVASSALFFLAYAICLAGDMMLEPLLPEFIEEEELEELDDEEEELSRDFLLPMVEESSLESLLPEWWCL